MFVEILPNVFAPIIVEFTVRIGYAMFAIPTLSSWARRAAAVAGLGARHIHQLRRGTAGYWWEVLFDALAIATLVVASI